MGWKAERYPQDHQQVADHRIVDGDKVIAFCPTGYPFENVELMAMAPALLRVVRAADACKDSYHGCIDTTSGEGYDTDEDYAMLEELKEALEALPEHLRHE